MRLIAFLCCKILPRLSLQLSLWPRLLGNSYGHGYKCGCSRSCGCGRWYQESQRTFLFVVSQTNYYVIRVHVLSFIIYNSIDTNCQWPFWSPFAASFAVLSDIIDGCPVQGMLMLPHDDNIITMSSSPCHHHVIITMSLSSCHHHVIIMMSSSCHHHVIIIMSS